MNRPSEQTLKRWKEEDNMKKTYEVLYNPTLLTMDEARRMIASYTQLVNAIGVQVRATLDPVDDRMDTIKGKLEQYEAEHKRILKRLLYDNI